MRIQLKKSTDIIYYTPRFYPSISGAEFYIMNLANQMHSSQLNVQILCSTAIDFKGIRSRDGLHTERSHPNYKSYKGIPIHRIIPEYTSNMQEFNLLLEGKNVWDGSNYKSLLENGPNHTKFFIDLLKNRKTTNFSCKIIHSSYLPYASILFGSIYSHQLDIPSVCTPFIHMNNPRYQKTSYELILNTYNRIITCTQTEKTYLLQRGISQHKIVTIPMGVDYRLYKSPPTTRSGRQKSFKNSFGIKNPFVLFCGYKNFEKGAINLLHAANLTKNVLPSLLFVFLGPSTPAFDIELKKARQNGILVLNLTPDNLKGYYDWRKISAFQECEMYVMPSRSDAYGISYLEAWASKKPVIGADTPVMREVIRHEKDGLLVKFDDISGIADSIVELFENKQKSNEMGLSGYSKVRKQNSWEIVGLKTKEVYDQLIEFKN
ncbi:MAG: glycosyltransferase family 1 protein [Promethearchaeota archaeon]|nr:MAG: glycosyltransferase family 1 protein [Candidatus Lokiarchaeota archaeon]